MLNVRTTTNRGTRWRRAGLGLLGGAVVLVASACRSSEVCVRPLADPVAPAAPSTLPEPPPGQDDVPFVLELSAAATDLEYAGVVELEIVARAVADGDAGRQSNARTCVLPRGSFSDYSEGEGLYLETWARAKGASEYVQFRDQGLSFWSVEHVCVTEHGLEFLHDLTLINPFVDSNGSDGPPAITLRPGHAVRASLVHGLDLGGADTSTNTEARADSPLRFLLKEPGASYQVRAVMRTEGDAVAVSNWVELTTEADVSQARQEAVLVIEVLGLANKARGGAGGAGGTWQFPYVEEAETAVLTLVDSRFQSNLPKWMREWADAVWISAGHEVRSWGGSGLAEVQPVRVYRACIELLEATDYWTEIPRTLPRQYASLRDRIQYSLDWAREESERQRRATWDTGSKERSDPATPDSDR
ncbi:hypothetical protein Pla163_26260 [Planctomycetes bacterium Pla163]|uniref:Uncharacterized protein n=1 Tax=Rohdeia mirabilis TaxID=2528008 RepID=A0A518D229_9BACT|nr:hypothetical protein Pla163_26260 [Planctomycetes bacterium Pla163]